MEYAALVDVYDRLAATDSSNEKRDTLADVFADAGALLPRLVTLVRGRLSPAYDRMELGVSSSLTLAAILRASGAPEATVRDRWRETGDLGDAAAWAVDNGGQQTLVSATLTVERVHDDLRELATYEGSGSQDRKVDTLVGLLADADANEARYVVRTALGHMRVGVGEGTIRDALAHAFLDGSDDVVDAVERAASAWGGTDDVAPAERLYREALDGGHEGVMVKNPGATYQPGRRVGRLLKHKPTMEPLDLVVTRATYSEGRRSEWLGRLYLGAYDPAADAFREVGRLSTGYTDEELAALTDRLGVEITARDGRDVDLRPTVVLEIEYEELQASSEYGSGYALRFPRFLGVGEDLDPTDADTVERLYDSQ